MKCLILAGGRGERLWPLSRKNYPKQFIQIQNNHSVFQETVLRNIPYCDEFIIVTNYEYRFIVANQMQAFQGISYRCVFEEEPKKTTSAITLACMDLQPSEYVYVVASTHMIDTKYETEDQELSYKDSIIRAKELAKQGAIVLFGLYEKEINPKFGYINGIDNEGYIKGFCEKPSKTILNKMKSLSEIYRNLGMCLFQNVIFQNELQIYAEEIYRQCQEVYQQRRYINGDVFYSKEAQKTIDAMAIEKSLYEKSKIVRAVKVGFHWKNIGSLEDLTQLELGTEGISVKNDCSNTVIINDSPKKAVVVNDLDNVLVVNTSDAIYVGRYGKSSSLKEILHDNHELRACADQGHFFYRSWGYYEQLLEEKDYRIRRVTLFPGRTIYAHQHIHRVENWTIVKGQVLITIGDKKSQYTEGESINIPERMTHQISNIGEESAVFVETAVGQIGENNDVIGDKVDNLNESQLGYSYDPIIKLLPAYKDYIWGGSKLREIYNMDCDYDIIAESWQLSAHKDGQSIVASGKHKGMRFGEYLNVVGKDVLGWKCSQLYAFPLMIKFIDAKQNLSIQVHPNDEYALENEGEYGKNEMWYVIDATPGSGLYIGFNRSVDSEEVRKRIENDSITEIMNFYPTKAGDVFFIPAGTVHAIGAGNLICEIQQSSNCTYRLYDYKRRDKSGNLRELHLEKALDIITYEPYDPQKYKISEEQKSLGTVVLSSCKYFEAILYETQDRIKIRLNDDRFSSVVCLKGEGIIRFKDCCMEIFAGDSFFIPAANEVLGLEGDLSVIVSHI